MPRGRPVTDETRASVVQLHAAGKGRNEIAVELDIAAASVSAIVKAAGLSFDRSKTSVAVKAHQVDLAIQRAELAQMALATARRLLTQMEQPHLAFNFGGKDNTYAEHELKRPPTGDLRNLMTSFGIAVQRSMELSKFDADPSEGLSAVDDWLAAVTQ